MEEEFKNINNKMKDIATTMLTMNDIEYHTLEGGLDQLAKQQQLLKIQEKTNEVATQLQILMSEIQAKHQNIRNLRTPKELEKFISNATQTLANGGMPQLSNPEDIFAINPIRKSIKNDLVTVQFQIPLISTKNFTHFAIISAPGPERSAIALNGERLVITVAEDSANKTYFNTAETKKIHKTIYATRFEIIDDVNLFFRPGII